jgi:two-component system chemotaxis family response regulator WspR
MNEDRKPENDAVAEHNDRCVVLLVDDQAIVAEAIRRMLVSEKDIDLHYCNDPKLAIETAAKVAPTVILQDLVMPDIDGMMLVRFFRGHQATRSVPIIVLSSKEAALDKSEAFSNGASDYLVKLPDRIELIARIRAHSRSYLAQMQRDEAYRVLSELQIQLEQKNEELERLSSLDGLTGIPNRRIFDETLENEWKRASRNLKPLGLLLIDIDYFKLFNDNYGHQGGDDCLKQVAKTLRVKLKRGGDMVARYGGEEFAVILPATDIPGAEAIAKGLCDAINELNLPHAYSKVADHVTISMGVASVLPQGGEEPSHLITLADEALYAAKEQGRNRYHCSEASVVSTEDINHT